MKCFEQLFFVALINLMLSTIELDLISPGLWLIPTSLSSLLLMKELVENES